MLGALTPSSGYSKEARLDALSIAERLLVVTVRLLVLPRSAAGARADWRAGLRAARVDECAGPALEALFRVVAAAQRQPLDIRCPCRPGLGEDEAKLLRMVSHFQHAWRSEGEAILAEWLPPAAQRLASTPAQVLAAAMERRGLLIPGRTRPERASPAISWAVRDPSYTRLQ